MRYADASGMGPTLSIPRRHWWLPLLLLLLLLGRRLPLARKVVAEIVLVFAGLQGFLDQLPDCLIFWLLDCDQWTVLALA